MIRTHRGSFTAVAFGGAVAVFGCAGNSPLSPTSTTSAAAVTSVSDQMSSANPSRPIQGSCETVVTPLDPANAGACSAFEAAPSVFIAISGQCQLSHLGRVSLSARQQVLFLLDASGQPVFTALRNCGVFTASNRDELRHTTSGTVAPGTQPGTVSYEGSLTFTGGSGRFASASGVAAFSGSASLLTNTGTLAIEGAIQY